jgi:sigma-E factor negative regulatory protein RseB
MRIGLACCGLLLVTNVCAKEAVHDWLNLALRADHQTSYSGVFVYQYGNHVETTKISHIVNADSEYEKLESQDGPKREIIRHHGQVWCNRDHKLIPLGNEPRRFPLLLPDQLSSLNTNYQVKELGMDRVAGNNARVVLYQSRDNLRYSHKIWVGTDSGLLLKSAVLNDKNQIVEQYAFTELRFGEEMDRSWLKVNMPPVVPEINLSKLPDINSGWVVDALPAGYKKTMEILRPMHGRHAPVTQLVFSDGLSAISVFIEIADADGDDNESLTSRGALNLYHKVVDGHLYNVVGEVPPKTVMQVLDSIRFNGKL